ncbi:hypothetical protein T484DRAFT_1783413, partial [Baffinella frigidus]
VQPPRETEAGKPFRVQPELLTLDGAGQLVRDQKKTVNATLVRDQKKAVDATACSACACPCPSPPRSAEVHRENCAPGARVNLHSKEGLFGAGFASVCYGSPFLVGNSVMSEEGSAAFSTLRVLPTGDFKVYFSVSGSTLNATMHVKPCVPRDMELSNASRTGLYENFPPGVSDTGSSFCDGRDCVIEVRDAFGNLASSRELLITAEISDEPKTNVAGFSASPRCTCTGVSSVPGVGAVGTISQAAGDYNLFDSDYGTRCEAWDTLRRDCAAAWPGCTPGWWCCRTWCYVDSACPGSRPDPLVPGLYYSYDACSEDPTALSTCNFKSEANCTSRDTRGALPMEPRANILSGGAEVIASSGLAVFTDLSTSVPGRYALVFRARSGSQILSSARYTFGVTPILPAKIVMAVEPGNSTTFGNRMAVQPQVALLDRFDNPVVNEWICPAVTASVAQSGAAAPQVFGQKANDTMTYCQIETFHTSGCIISAHAIDGFATFSHLQARPISGGAVDGLQIQFTHGCCADDPADCYCASPDDPRRVDTGRETGRFIEPCRVVRTLPFSLLPLIGGLQMLEHPVHSIAGERISAAVNILTAAGSLNLGASEAIGVRISSCSGGDTCPVVLQGTTVAVTRNGRADFDGLSILNFQERASFTFQFTVISHPEHNAVSSPFDVAPSDPFSMTIESTASYLTVTQPLRAVVTIRDIYSNPADVDGEAVTISVVSLVRAALATPKPGLKGDLTVPLVSSRAYMGITPPDSYGGGMGMTPVVVEGDYVIRFEAAKFGLAIEKALRVGVGTISTNNVWYEVESMQRQLIAWEPFFFRVRVVDDEGNHVKNANIQSFDSLSLSTLPEILKADSIFGGCQVDTVVAGYAEPAYIMPVEAESYPSSRVIKLAGMVDGIALVATTIITDVTAPVTELRVDYCDVTAPVTELRVDYCVTQRICEAYFPNRVNNTCPCQEDATFDGTLQTWPLPQLVDEKFFWFPRVRMYDSAGELASRSSMPSSLPLTYRDFHLFTL